MLTVVSLSAQQTLPQLKAHANAALNVGVTPAELREAVYLCAPFVGFPKTLNALGVINEVFAERGIKLPLESQGKTAEEERFAAGSAIQQPLYGSEIKEALAGLPGNMGEDAARFLTEFCFGDIYTRGGLDVKTRELLAIGILVTTGNMQTLQSHIAGQHQSGKFAGNSCRGDYPVYAVCWFSECAECSETAEGYAEVNTYPVRPFCRV